MPLSEILSLRIDKEGGPALYLQLYNGLRLAILQGRLKPGGKILSAREMAKELGLSRNTVNTAYEQLQAEGYLVTRMGAGSFVTEGLPDVFPQAVPGEGERESSAEFPSRLSRWGEFLKAKPVISGARGQRGIFAPGEPDLDAFPFKKWARLMGRVWRYPKADLTLVDHPGGYAPLREAVSEYLRAGRALGCSPDQVIITGGAQQALDIAFRLLIDPGDKVWVEDPGFKGIDGALAGVGASLVPVPLNNEGLDLERGIEMAPEAKIALVTPSRNFPLGTALSLNRRLDLLAWARENNRWVIEDDFDSEFRFDGRPLASLQGMDNHDRVLYAGTFSRVLFPSLRLGYLVVPKPLVDIARSARLFMDGHGSILPQVALAEFFNQGLFSSHLRRMKKLYKTRAKFLESELRAQLGAKLEISPTDSGMHLVLFLPGRDDLALSKQLLEEGVVARALSPFYRLRDQKQGLILGFAAYNEPQLREGVSRLKRVLGVPTS